MARIQAKIDLEVLDGRCPRPGLVSNWMDARLVGGLRPMVARTSEGGSAPRGIQADDERRATLGRAHYFNPPSVQI